MEQSPSEAVNRSASPKLVRNPRVHHRIHKSPLLEPILRTINLVYKFQLCFLKIHLLLLSHLCIGVPSGSSLQPFHPKFCKRFLSIHVCHMPNHFTALDLVILTISGEGINCYSNIKHQVYLYIRLLRVRTINLFPSQHNKLI
jgi:hypothetical protein